MEKIPNIEETLVPTHDIVNDEEKIDIKSPEITFLDKMKALGEILLDISGSRPKESGKTTGEEDKEKLSK